MTYPVRNDERPAYTPYDPSQDLCAPPDGGACEAPSLPPANAGEPACFICVDAPEASPGQAALVKAAKPRRTLPPPDSVPRRTDNNAQRVADRQGHAPRPLEMGVTSSRDAAFVSTALVSGTDENGAWVDTVTSSAQVGLQNEAQSAVTRGGAPIGDGSAAEVEIIGASGSLGIHNVDGSEGFNAGLLVNIAAVQLSHEDSGDSILLGASIGAGAAFSAGVRDGDGDGRDEFCFRVDAGPITVAACREDR